MVAYYKTKSTMIYKPSTKINNSLRLIEDSLMSTSRIYITRNKFNRKEAILKINQTCFPFRKAKTLKHIKCSIDKGQCRPGQTVNNACFKWKMLQHIRTSSACIKINKNDLRCRPTFHSSSSLNSEQTSEDASNLC